MIMKDLNWFTLENIFEDRVANESVLLSELCTMEKY